MPKEIPRWEDEPLVDDPDIDWSDEGDRWVPAITDRHPNDPRLDKTEQLREIRFIWKCRRLGLTQHEIAAKMERSQPWVAKRIRQGMELFRPPGLDEERITAIERCEEEYEDVRNALRDGEIEMKDAIPLMDRIERRKMALMGTAAPKKYEDVTKRPEGKPSSTVLADIQAAEAERRKRVEQEWEQDRSDGTD